MIFNPVGLQDRQTGSSIRTKVLLRTMLLDTTAHQDVLVKQALRAFIDQRNRLLVENGQLAHALAEMHSQAKSPEPDRQPTLWERKAQVFEIAYGRPPYRE